MVEKMRQESPEKYAEYGRSDEKGLASLSLRKFENLRMWLI